jgi:hypothetical protein
MESCVDCLKKVRENRYALIALKLFTLVSGIFMFASGLSGLIYVFRTPFYLVISIYAMIFGFTVVGARWPCLACRPCARRAFSPTRPPLAFPCARSGGARHMARQRAGSKTLLPTARR